MVKSRMQTDGFTPSTGQKYASARDCVRQVWRTEGIGAFTRGLGPTLIRSVALHSLIRGVVHTIIQVSFREWSHLPWI